MLPRHHRLTRPDDFRAVTRSGARAGGRVVVVTLLPVATPCPGGDPAQARCPASQPPRVGFVVGRSVGSAVVRNRVVRRLRAHLGSRLPELPEGVDIVVRALPGAASATFEELGSDTDRCLDRALAKVGPRAGTASRRAP